MHSIITRGLLIIPLFLSLILAGCRPSKPSTNTEPTAVVPSYPVIIDTDMAADDWMAILYLLQREDIEVKAITVSGTGEAHCDPGVQNATGLVALAGENPIPVSCGRETPLAGNHTFPESWRSGVDSLFGMSLPAGGAGSTLNATELLISEILSSPVKVTLLTLGPLTNLAEAIQKEPSIVDNIAQVYIMGGALEVPGNIAITGAGIDNQVAEWNIYIDPLAAQVVLDSGAPITLVPLDATNDVPLTRRFYSSLKSNHNSAEAKFIYNYYKNNQEVFDYGTMYFWDQLTAVTLSDNSIAEYETKPVCVIQSEGAESGQTVINENCPEIRVTVSANGDLFESLFLDTVNH